MTPNTRVCVVCVCGGGGSVGGQDIFAIMSCWMPCFHQSVPHQLCIVTPRRGVELVAFFCDKSLVNMFLLGFSMVCITE